MLQGVLILDNDNAKDKVWLTNSRAARVFLKITDSLSDHCLKRSLQTFDSKSGESSGRFLDIIIIIIIIIILL